MKTLLIKSRQGFTLIELLVVIVIIGILATLATVALTSSRANARDARRISDLKQISTALEMYQADYNAYPSAITAGNALTSPDGSKTFMNKVPGDPSTNTSYAYGGNTNFTIRAVLEKGAADLPAGNIIITSRSGIKLPDSTDARLVDDALTFGGYLIGHWALDGITEAVDLSGNSNDGNKINNVAVTTGRFGELAGAYIFDGSSDYVDIPNSTLFDLQTFTISAWVYSNEFIQKGTVFVKGPVNSQYQLYLEISGTTPRYVFRTKSSADALDSLGYSPTNHSPSTWHHIVATYNGSNKKIYNDGVEGASNAYTQTIKTGQSGQRIGAFGMTDYDLDGKISDVRIYSKALVPSEISALYQATKP